MAPRRSWLKIFSAEIQYRLIERPALPAKSTLVLLHFFTHTSEEQREGEQREGEREYDGDDDDAPSQWKRYRVLGLAEKEREREDSRGNRSGTRAP